ncbi:MAG: hypothetical protein GX984_07130 [Erysipelothrix sp.]|nr:hypothetical protein [Erysipelothrix sp.]
MAKKTSPAVDVSLKQWLLTDRSTRRLRKQIKRAERQGATKKELQEMAKQYAADTLLRKTHPTTAAIVYAALEQTKWAGIVNSILAG